VHKISRPPMSRYCLSYLSIHHQMTPPPWTYSCQKRLSFPPDLFDAQRALSELHFTCNSFILLVRSILFSHLHISAITVPPWHKYLGVRSPLCHPTRARNRSHTKTSLKQRSSDPCCTRLHNYVTYLVWWGSSQLRPESESVVLRLSFIVDSHMPNTSTSETKMTHVFISLPNLHCPSAFDPHCHLWLQRFCEWIRNPYSSQVSILLYTPSCPPLTAWPQLPSSSPLGGHKSEPINLLIQSVSRKV
jgi:hypothetical protein